MFMQLPDNGYFIAIGGEGKMFTLRKGNRLGEEWHIQNLAHTWEEAEQRAFEVTGFHLAAPECILNPLASQVTREDATMPYGKYRGMTLQEVIDEDVDYLCWWAERCISFYAENKDHQIKKIDRIIMELPEVTAVLEERKAAKAAREAKWEAERQKLRESSQYLGTIGERIQFTGTIAFVKHGGDEYQPWTLTKLITDDGSVVTYWNTYGLDASAIGFDQYKLDGKKGDHITFFAAVKNHEEYNGIKQTVVKRATRGKMLCPGWENVEQLRSSHGWCLTQSIETHEWLKPSELAALNEV